MSQQVAAYSLASPNVLITGTRRPAMKPKTTPHIYHAEGHSTVSCRGLLSELPLMYRPRGSAGQTILTAWSSCRVQPCPRHAPARRACALISDYAEPCGAGLWLRVASARARSVRRHALAAVVRHVVAHSVRLQSPRACRHRARSPVNAPSHSLASRPARRRSRAAPCCTAWQ